MEDWPIGYDELEPYYDIVEHEVGVSGKAGNIQGKIDKEGNIFEGPRQREYPMPHLRTCDYLEMMKKAARSLGWNPFHSPAAINSVPRDGRGACGYHGYCDRGGCHLRSQELNLLFDHSESAGDQEPDHLRSRAGDAHRCRTRTAR